MSISSHFCGITNILTHIDVFLSVKRSVARRLSFLIVRESFLKRIPSTVTVPLSAVIALISTASPVMAFPIMILPLTGSYLFLLCQPPAALSPRAPTPVFAVPAAFSTPVLSFLAAAARCDAASRSIRLASSASFLPFSSCALIYASSRFLNATESSSAKCSLKSLSKIGATSQLSLSTAFSPSAIIESTLPLRLYSSVLIVFVTAA